MAAVLTMVGGSLGFFVGLVGLIALDFGILLALAAWVGIGVGFCAIGVASAFLPSRSAERLTTRRA